jgi:biopolymer transport protein TolQ
MNMTVNTGIFHAIWSAGLVVKFTLLLLGGASIVSWALIIDKRRQFQQAARANEPFLESFWKATSLDVIFQQVQTNSQSPLARIFKTGYVELQKLATARQSPAGEEKSGPPLLSGIDNLQRALTKAIDQEISALEDRLTILATIGSTGPFIGLFGTVWGIMSSFQQIGVTGTANLAVVAPGISEALIATAIGLAAAIPAVVFYNHFLTHLKKQELTLTTFSSDFLNIAKRNFFRDK